jgi:hypothetical protein
MGMYEPGINGDERRKKLNEGEIVLSSCSQFEVDSPLGGEGCLLFL